eukprot:scaffold14226_cov186-Amphora_coffeaeformis.AAC.7
MHATGLQPRNNVARNIYNNCVEQETKESRVRESGIRACCIQENPSQAQHDDIACTTHLLHPFDGM